LIKKF
jgi:ribosomal protein S11